MFSSASILDPWVSLAQVCNQGKRFAIEGLLLGGFGIKPFAYLKNRERLCEWCRQQNPRNSGFHFHPPGVAFWRAPFVANEAISTNLA
jgi:hypothetical protein